MMAEYRRFARTAAVVLSLSHGVSSFVVQTSSVLLRLHSPPSVASESGQQRTRSSSSCSHSNRRLDSDVFKTQGCRDDMVEQSTEGLGLDRRQVLTRAWKAALSLSTLGVVVAGAAPPAGAGIGEFLLPPQDISTEVNVGKVDKEITFDDFNRSLLKGEVWYSSRLDVPKDDSCENDIHDEKKT
ncbi:unnamed protein product [Laminaria digitata]